MVTVNLRGGIEVRDISGEVVRLQHVSGELRH